MAHAPITAAAADKYYIPHGSPWPIVGSVAIFTIMCGAVLWLNEVEPGPWVLLSGLGILTFMCMRWFGTVIGESEARIYNAAVDRSFRLGMMWFSFSQAMFFGAFFGALVYARQLSVPWLGGEGVKFLTKFLEWPQYEPAWPTNGPGNVGGTFETIPAFGVPALNTAILLLSGVTVTIAQRALKAGRRLLLKLFLAATFLLGFLFVGIQATQYHAAYAELNLTLGSGVYGSTFFMLTGFHGFHVTLGAIMLTVIWFRCTRGHFTPKHHFAFEGVAWYWYFVDAVWLALFVFVYWI